MPNQYSFINFFPPAKRVIVPSELGSDIVVFEDTGWITLTFTGTDASKWWSFTSPAISEIIVAGLLNRSAGTTRYTDNEKAVAASTQVWINDNLFAPPGSTWQNNIINLFELRIDIVHGAGGPSQIVRSYSAEGTGRISTDAEQPGCIEITAFRFN